MKESGDIWIGKIPSSWDIKKLKYLTKQSTVRAQSNDGYIALENVDSWNNRYIETGIKSEGDTLVANKGQVLFGKLRPYLAKVYLMPKDGCCSSEFLVLTPTDINARYLLYGMTSAPFISRVDVSTYGTKMPRANAGFINNLLFPVPSPSEQSRIATFLDERCVIIDEAIARHQALIEKLEEYRKAVITKAVTKGVRGEREMKESGFERVGLIPSDWNYRPLKSIGRFYGGMSGKAGDDFKVEDDDVFTYFIPYTNIFNNSVVNPRLLAKVKTKEGESQNCVHKGDLLFLMSSEDYAGLGQTSVMLEEVENLWLNSFCKGLHNTSSDVDSKWLNYYLTSELIHDYIRVKGEGYTRINLKTSNLGICPIFVPTHTEQQEIVEYLDAKCAAIDSAKERHTQLIAKLEEYKKSLIYNAVTGKIEC